MRLRVVQNSPRSPGFIVGFLAGQEIVWLSEALRFLRDEAPDIEITLSSPVLTRASPDALMQGKVDVAILRRETRRPQASPLNS